MSETPKNPVGRPTLYRDEMCAEIVECGKQGFSHAEMAVHLGVTRETVTEWAKANPEFSAAVTHARELSLAWWEAAARQGLPMGSGFNATLWAKSMSGRFPKEPYRDRVEQSGPDGGPMQVDVSGLTEDQLKALATIKLTD